MCSWFAQKVVSRGGAMRQTGNRAAWVPELQFLIGNYVKRIEVQDGAVHDVNAAIESKVLSMRPQVVQGGPASPMSWSCGYHCEPSTGLVTLGENRTDIDQRYVPAACRRPH